MPTFKRFAETARRATAAASSPPARRQTNEVGRCAIFLPAFGLLADEVGPLGLLDVGASGGLNLLLDRYEYRYTSRDGVVATVGGPSSVVHRCRDRQGRSRSDELPTIAIRCGIDHRPIDVTDDAEAQWLEACVWPDQPDRFHRLVAAIEIARSITAGAARRRCGDVARCCRRTRRAIGPSGGHELVGAELPHLRRSRARISPNSTGSERERDLSWIYAEAPALIPELPNGPDPKDPHRTVLSLVRWRNGARTVDHLATCHPHGFWIHWR